MKPFPLLHVGAVMEKKHQPEEPCPPADDGEAKDTNLDPEKARGGRIILNTRRRRIIFTGGLVVWGLFMIVAAFLGNS